MKSGVVNIHAIVQLMIGKICVIKWHLMPGKSGIKLIYTDFSMDGLDYIASICRGVVLYQPLNPSSRQTDFMVVDC